MATHAAAAPQSPAASGRGRRFILIGAAFAVFLVVVVGGYAFNWSWTGFRGNTLWEWLQLLVLPVVLTGGGIWFNMHQNGTNRAVAERQHEIDLHIADDNQQEAALQAYLDHLSQLLLDKQLKESAPGSAIRELAHARTLTAVWHVGKFRKGVLLKFLYEAHLISRENAIIELHEADLSDAHLDGIDLSGADLHGAHFVAADLRGARLTGAHLGKATLARADLSGADLSRADLTEADLRGANLSGADLTGTLLAGANFHGATLSGAKVEDAHAALIPSLLAVPHNAAS